jgi:HK97 gp10 family phage protein
MSDDFQIETLGLKELGETLDKMPLRFQQKIQRAALKASGDVVAATMRANCPVAPKAAHPDSEPGEMRDAIGVKVYVARDLSDSAATISPQYSGMRDKQGHTSRDPGVYCRFVEYGTARANPEPFVRPTFVATAADAEAAYAYVVETLLTELVEHGYGGSE